MRDTKMSKTQNNLIKIFWKTRYFVYRTAIKSQISPSRTSKYFLKMQQNGNLAFSIFKILIMTWGVLKAILWSFLLFYFTMIVHWHSINHCNWQTFDKILWWANSAKFIYNVLINNALMEVEIYFSLSYNDVSSGFYK